VPKIGVFTHVWPWEVIVIADLDTLLIALYVELTDRIIPSLGFTRSGPGQRPVVTDAELACLAVAQTSDAVKLSSCLGDFLAGGWECGGFVVFGVCGQAVVEAAEETAEQVALGGGVPVTVGFAAVVVGSGAG
jgi:hypothetical protein